MPTGGNHCPHQHPHRLDHNICTFVFKKSAIILDNTTKPWARQVAPKNEHLFSKKDKIAPAPLAIVAITFDIHGNIKHSPRTGGARLPWGLSFENAEHVIHSCLNGNDYTCTRGNINTSELLCSVQLWKVSKKKPRSSPHHLRLNIPEPSNIGFNQHVHHYYPLLMTFIDNHQPL